MADSYLQIARSVLLAQRRPMRVRDIMEVAKQAGLIPEHLRGKTQHKTLQARLAEDIALNRERSLFYRTAPGVYFLWCLRQLPEFQCERYRPRWNTRPRRKEIKRERVLAIPVDFLCAIGLDGLSFNPHELVYQMGREHMFSYIDRKEAERRYDFKQVVTYTLVVRGDMILTYRRGKFTNISDEMKNARSVGFGGHVDADDVDLFENDPFGISRNAKRELQEELFLTESEALRLDAPECFRMVGVLNSNETDEALKHVAFMMVYLCSDQFEPNKNELSINDLRWMGRFQIPNNPSEFEPWSQTVLERIRKGDIL